MVFYSLFLKGFKRSHHPNRETGWVVSNCYTRVNRMKLLHYIQVSCMWCYITKGAGSPCSPVWSLHILWTNDAHWRITRSHLFTHTHMRMVCCISFSARGSRTAILASIQHGIEWLLNGVVIVRLSMLFLEYVLVWMEYGDECDFCCLFGFVLVTFVSWDWHADSNTLFSGTSKIKLGLMGCKMYMGTLRSLMQG